MAKRHPRASLFVGYWTTIDGKKIRRIRRDEYPDLYRLWRKHTAQRLGVTIVGMVAPWTLGGATVPAGNLGPADEVVPPNVYSSSARFGNLHPGAS